MKKTTLFFSLLAMMFLVGCGNTTDTPVVKDVQNVQILKTNASLYVTADSLQLHANINYSDGSSADVTEACGWESDDYNKIAVSYGKLYAKANGDGNGNTAFVNVTAYYKNLLDTTKVELIPLKALNIVDENNTNHNGSSGVIYTFSAKATYADNTTLPLDTNNSRNLKWFTEGNVTSFSESNGTAYVTFGTGKSTVIANVFDVNGSFDINITN